MSVSLCVDVLQHSISPFLKALHCLWLFWTSAQHTPFASPHHIVCPLSRMTFNTHTHKWHLMSPVYWYLVDFFSFLLFFSCRAVVEKYLLEKSRLVSREKNERWGGTAGVLTPNVCWPFWGPLYKHEESLMFGYEVQVMVSGFICWLYVSASTPINLS